MTWKQFVSPDERLLLMLPELWEQYDDGDENTYAFFDTQQWSGNLRITPFYWPETGDDGRDRAQEFVDDEFNDNENAIRLKIGGFDGAHYKKGIQQDGDDLVVYYWTFGHKDNLFICSFTIDQSQEDNLESREALSIVSKILGSVKPK
jgi:hypothetical protein